MTSSGGDLPTAATVPAEIDTSVAHPGRMYDYLLGGTTNFTADRAAVEAGAEVVGGIEYARASIRANRAFLIRAVRWLVSQAGMRQFLDVGTGIPTMQNVHEVAQEIAPTSRVVYVDNDPIVLAHAHTLLRGTPEGATAYINGDLREPDLIVRQAAQTLDLKQPVAVVLVAILHFLADEDDPSETVEKLVSAVPSGSYLVVSHLAADIQPSEMGDLAERFDQDETIAERFVMRTQMEVTRFFDGLNLVDPGVVAVDQWHPDEATPQPPAGWVNPFWCGIGMKP